MILHGYQEIDHTADLALKVWGANFHVLMKWAAQGMYDLMGINLNVESPIEYKFHIEVGSLETILVDFLSELLYRCEEKQEAFINFLFATDQERLDITAKGYKVKTLVRSIKAVTYHDLNIKMTETGMETTITFDV